MEFHNKEAIGPLLGLCGQHCRQWVDHALREKGITQAQAHVVLYIINAEKQGEVHQKDLEKRFQIRASTVNGLVERLEEKGFITREAAKSDARCRCLRVTEQGRLLEQELRRRIWATENQMMSGFSREEKAALRQMLLRMAENLREEGTL